MLDAVTPMLSAIVTVYGLVSGASSLLQARQLVRRGTSSDVSLAFLGLYVAGYGLWLLYGLTIGSLPLILVDAVGLLCGAATLALAVRLPRAAPRTPDSALGLAAAGPAPLPAQRSKEPSGRPRSTSGRACPPTSAPPDRLVVSPDRAQVLGRGA